MRFKKFIIISIYFLPLAPINFIFSNFCNAMFDLENEMEKRKTTHVAPKDQKKPEETELKKENDILSQVVVYQDNSSFGVLSDDILIYVFVFLKTEDLGRVSQVSRRWYNVYSEPQLWRKVGLENYKDYFTRADFEEKPKEKVIHHYLSVRLNVLDTEEEARVSRKFKEKYGLTSFTPYFKAFLPSAVKKGHESFGAKVYGKFEVVQDIETEKEIKRLRRKRDSFIQLAKQEATEKTIGNPYFNGRQWQRAMRFGTILSDYTTLPNYNCSTIIKTSAPNRIRLEAAREINEKLIELGDVKAGEMKKLQLSDSSEYGAVHNLYKGCPRDWDNFLKSSAVDEFCSKGYLFAFEWKIEWLVEHNKDGMKCIETMLQNENPVIRNMGHYLRVSGLKQGKWGYKKNQEEAAQYIRLQNIPY